MQTGKDPVHKGYNQVFFLKKRSQVESAGPKDDVPSINAFKSRLSYIRDNRMGLFMD